ncbi:Remorin [Rhynchospora pubera]|uniref:Remorin n=1 Tax=Rhynchospora pubera TaxID=906938 RepID=A0AAV8EXS2_9POAL|nr:Remorin [Rhynchospora pubera]
MHRSLPKIDELLTFAPKNSSFPLCADCFPSVWHVPFQSPSLLLIKKISYRLFSFFVRRSTISFSTSFVTLQKKLQCTYCFLICEHLTFPFQEMAEETKKVEAAVAPPPEPEKDIAEEKVVVPPPAEEKPDDSKALVVTEKAEPTAKGGSHERDAFLARLETEKRISLIKAWEESEKAKAENKAARNLSTISSWENSKKASIEAEIKKIEEDLEKKKAAYAEKLKNKIALLHKQAEEKRAMTEAKKGEDLLKAEETAAKYRATGLAPKTVFSRAVGCFGA